VSLLERRPYFTQILEKLHVKPEHFQVVVNRVTRTQVEELLAAWDAIFFRGTGDQREDRHMEIQQLFSNAYADYLQEGGKEDASGFKQFLDRRQGQSETVDKVLADIKGIRELFRKLDKLGLTNKEVSLSKETTVLDLGVDGITPDQLKNLFEARGSVWVLEEPKPGDNKPSEAKPEKPKRSKQARTTSKNEALLVDKARESAPKEVCCGNL